MRIDCEERYIPITLRKIFRLVTYVMESSSVLN